MVWGAGYCAKQHHFIRILVQVALRFRPIGPRASAPLPPSAPLRCPSKRGRQVEGYVAVSILSMRLIHFIDQAAWVLTAFATQKTCVFAPSLPNHFGSYTCKRCPNSPKSKPSPTVSTPAF